MADVFVSYARLDRERVAPLKMAIEGLGLSAFFDVEGLDGGDVFPDVLDREVKTAKVVLGCWTPHALSRDWVKTECAIAREQRSLVPLEFERLAALDVPAAFYQLQRVDMSSWRGERRHDGWLAAARAISRKLGRPEIYDRARAIAAVPNAASTARALPAAEMNALWCDWEKLALTTDKAAIEDLKARAAGTPIETLATTLIKDLERPAAARALLGSQSVGLPSLRGWRLVRYLARRAAVGVVVLGVAAGAYYSANQRANQARHEATAAQQEAVVAQEQVTQLTLQLEEAQAKGAYQFRPRNDFMRERFVQGVELFFATQLPNRPTVLTDVQAEYREAFLARSDIFAAYGLDTPERAAAFLGQAAIETNYFRAKTENLNYSFEALRRIWGHRFANEDEIRAYANNSERIANRIYANRMGNGPEESGDGWRFRGRGFFQITGRDNYTGYSELLGIDLVSQPDLLDEPEMAIAAAAIWWHARNLNEYADTGDVVAVSRATSRGNARSSAPAHGEALRIDWTQRWLAVFNANPNSTDALRLGARGEAVLTVQRDLAELGYSAGAQDGVFGPGLRQAVIAFQQEHTLPGTGAVDDATRRAVSRAVEEARASRQ